MRFVHLADLFYGSKMVAAPMAISVSDEVRNINGVSVSAAKCNSQTASNAGVLCSSKEIIVGHLSPSSLPQSRSMSFTQSRLFWRSGDALLYPKENPDTAMLQKKMWDLMLIFVAEVLGTSCLMLFGCMTGVTINDTPNILQAALGWGFVVGTIGMIVGHVSEAHLNPAVTLAAFILNRISPLKVLVYFAAEMIGAILGYGALLLVTPRQNIWDVSGNGCYTCMTLPQGDVSDLQAVAVEFFATAFLIYAVCGTWDPRNSSKNDSVTIRFSFVIASLVLAVGPYTQASMNPARSFAPAVVSWRFARHWIYWVGPLGGSIFSTLFYKYIFLQTDSDNEVKKDKRDQGKAIHSMEEASINVHREDIS